MWLCCSEDKLVRRFCCASQLNVCCFRFFEMKKSGCIDVNFFNVIVSTIQLSSQHFIPVFCILVLKLE